MEATFRWAVSQAPGLWVCAEDAMAISDPAALIAGYLGAGRHNPEGP
jgi:hypothetical protein